MANGSDQLGSGDVRVHEVDPAFKPRATLIHLMTDLIERGGDPSQFVALDAREEFAGILSFLGDPQFPVSVEAMICTAQYRIRAIKDIRDIKVRIFDYLANSAEIPEASDVTEIITIPLSPRVNALRQPHNAYSEGGRDSDEFPEKSGQGAA